MNGVKTGFWSRWYSLAVRACFENNKGKKKKEMRRLVKRLDHRGDVGTEYDSKTSWAGDEVWLWYRECGNGMFDQWRWNPYSPWVDSGQYRLVVSKARENEGAWDGEEKRERAVKLSVRVSGFVQMFRVIQAKVNRKHAKRRRWVAQQSTEIIHMSLVNISFLRKVFGESMRIGRWYASRRSMLRKQNRRFYQEQQGGYLAEYKKKKRQRDE